MEQGDTLEGRYGGQRGPIFLLVLQTGILTVLTLGIYRFWAKSRVRRYVCGMRFSPVVIRWNTRAQALKNS